MSGTISGTVTGPNGDPEQNVPVIVYEAGTTNFVSGTATDDSGNYSIPNLPDDTYDVEFDKGGYALVKKTDVSVQGGTTTVDATLDWAYRKVIGEADPARGVGVFGRSVSSEGKGYGVFGVSGGTEFGNTAIRAEATEDAFGISVDSENGEAIRAQADDAEAIQAESNQRDGIVADTFSDVNDGIVGRHRTSSGVGHGVYGRTDSSDESSAGVDGWATASSGTAVGVNGRVDSPDGYGVVSEGQLRAERDVTGNTSSNLRRHVATVENTSGSQDGDVLGLKTNVSDPESSVNFISFLDANSQVGQIEGDGSGGIAIKGTTADFAEYFPKADPDREFDDGDVVGLKSGEIVADTRDADAVFVVSSRPLLVGNKPRDEAADDCVALSLVGQVPVSVSAQVDGGDVLVPAGDQQGTAVPRQCRDGTDHPVVGIALASADSGDDVRTVIGCPALADRSKTEESRASRESERIEALEADNEQLHAELSQKEDRIDDLEAENDALRDRLADIEADLGIGGADAVPADD